MKRRVTELLLATTCCWFLAFAVTGGESNAKPTRKVVRAEDGLNLICEVRGKGFGFPARLVR